jgi:two-component system sensor histidine kinase YesM
MRTVSEQEKNKAAAEFKALQNQINPHFLYNTLNTIKWLALMKTMKISPKRWYRL